MPPQNKAVGDKWPPEVKRFIDGLITLFGKYERPSLTLNSFGGFTMTGIVKTLTPAEIQTAHTQANQIGGSSSLAITPGKFVLFAVLDNKNNARITSDKDGV